MESAEIRAENLSKWYGEIRGVSGINLDIHSGIVGLIGPNGAGKTTFLNLCCGLLEPSQGKITILGEPAFTGTRFRRQLGVVSQKDAVYPFMTVLEFVTVLTELHGFSKREAKERAVKAIERVQLGHKLHQRIEVLSKGMRQCLKLAQAIAHDPKILLLDELLTGCDPLVKYQIKTLLLEMVQHGATILLSSHNLKEMEALTQEVVIIHCGKIAAAGKIGELQQKLKHHEHKVLVQGTELRKLAQILLQHPEITGIEFKDNERSMMVQTMDPAMFYHKFTAILGTGEFRIEKILSQDQDLTSLFHYLVGEIKE